MGHSDKDLRVATQIAYMDFHYDGMGLNSNLTMRERYNNNPNDFAKFKKEDPELFNDLVYGKYSEWKVVNIKNQNTGHGDVDNGFYGCLIDTGEGDAIIGFRGSENMENHENLEKDWIKADAGLVNNPGSTSQQKSAEDFIKEIYNGTDENGVPYMDKYKSFSLTGHSLGGNLAEHATVTAPDAFYQKIDRTLNLDGPGFSPEYIAAHTVDIKKHAGKIDHYRCSFVGSMLQPLPGSNVKNMSSLYGDADNLFDYYTQQHATKNFLFDEDGNMIPAPVGPLTSLIYGFTMSADIMTFGAGDLFGEDMNGPVAVGELILFSALNPFYLHFLLSSSLIGGVSYWIKSNFDFFKEVLHNPSILSQIRERIKGKHQQRMLEKAVFKVQSDAFSSSISVLETCNQQLNAYCSEIENIKSNVSILLKVGAVFTVSCKLRLIESSLEKCSHAARNMSNSAEQCANLYIQCENNVKSI